jgi:hypothetical protein
MNRPNQPRFPDEIVGKVAAKRAGRTDHPGHDASDGRGDLEQVGDGLGVEKLVLSGRPVSRDDIR